MYDNDSLAQCAAPIQLVQPVHGTALSAQWRFSELLTRQLSWPRQGSSCWDRRPDVHVTCMWHMRMSYHVFTVVLKILKVFSVWRYSYIFQAMKECVCRKCMRPHSLILVCFSWSSDYQWSSKGGFKHGTATRHYVQRIFYSLVLHMPENKSKRSTTWYNWLTSSLGSLIGGLPGHLSFGVGVVAFGLGCTRREARLADPG